MKKLELLAPAKKLECGIAAIDHGADAAVADVVGIAAAGRADAHVGLLDHRVVAVAVDDHHADGVDGVRIDLLQIRVHFDVACEQVERALALEQIDDLQLFGISALMLGIIVVAALIGLYSIL